MSVVSPSLVELARSRRALEQARDNNDWPELEDADQALGLALDAAFDDDSRCAAELVHEMEKILHLYASIVAELPQEAASVMSKFPKHRS